MKKLISLLLVFAPCAALADVDQLQLRDGFVIEELPFEVPNARQMALTEGGTLIVGSRRKGSVYAITDALGDNPQVVELFEGLPIPSGVTVRDGDLYIGALNKILHVAQIDGNVVENPQHRVITESLPDKGHHGWKYLRFGADGNLYVPVGAPCNICLSEDERFASILKMDPVTGSTTVWAHGIRNTVGFDWHPVTGNLWFSDNGRDMMGDDVPAEEINEVTAAGQHFGYPFVHARGVEDPQFGTDPAREGKTFVEPRVEIQAHSAALGMTFYTGEQFPAEYENALFVAEHGSWNRSSKVGYRVGVMVEGDDGATHYSPFITGWLEDQSNWGRPNDVLMTPDGSLLISDDQKGVIYRVSYGG